MVLIQFMCQAVMFMFLFISTADSRIVFETSRSRYNVGDRVVLKCIIDNRHWITTSILRDDEEIAMCNLSPPSTCGRREASRPNYSYSMFGDVPTLTIESVTLDDNGVTFKCKWTYYEAVVSFYVNEKSTTDYIVELQQEKDVVKDLETEIEENYVVSINLIDDPVNSEVRIYYSATLVGLCCILVAGLSLLCRLHVSSKVHIDQ